MRVRGDRSAGGRRPGAAVAELAIVLPFLAFLFAVAADFCRAYHAAQVLDTCARTGALYASGSAARDPDAGTPEEAAKRAAVAEGAGLPTPLKPENVAVVYGTGTVTVTVTYRVPMATSYTGVTDAVAVTRRVTMALAPRAPGAR